MAGGLIPSWHCQEQAPSFLSLRMEALWEVMELLHFFLTFPRNSFVNGSYKLIFLEIFKEGTGEVNGLNSQQQKRLGQVCTIESLRPLPNRAAF